ncbi:iron-containing alcohol dehydrogenase [Candidatus Bipolaricaulota bacterium]|nr:iron-containing alcohol dehydrogenase [Candidatus Bipolaricaulota bacterium]
MEFFDWHQPTEIIFGWGRLDEVGDFLNKYGDKCLMVTGHTSKAKYPIYERIKDNLENRGIDLIHFDGVTTNPTTETVNEGSKLAVENDVDVVLGVGGGSSMDTAKAIAVGASHEGEAWDYRLFTDKEITENTLPIIAITTTSGTGSQVTPFSVVTNSQKKSKFALASTELCPEVSIVDPELMVTAPEHVTASTGFDAFAHSFETYIHDDSSPYTDLLAKEAIELIVKFLPIAMSQPDNKLARNKLAWADTLAGICISNAGTTLPHGIGMAIGGHAPEVLHGEALSVIYPEFTRYTYPSKIEKFSTVGRILDPELEVEFDEKAAHKSCQAIDEFLKEIGMYFNLEELGVPKSELGAIADDAVELPDYEANPRVANRDKILELIEKAYDRSL